MSITFDKSDFFSIFQNETDSPNQEKIIQSAQKKLQFNYTDITYENYQKIGQCKNNLGINVFKTIKNCGYLLIVEVITHLVKALFLGIPKAISENGNYLKAHLFYVMRDLQEIYGRIIAHFSRLYGQYLVERSSFHKTCYEVFLDKSEQIREANSASKKAGESKSGSNEGWRRFSHSSSLKYGVMVDSEAKNVSLFDYMQYSEEDKKNLVQRFMSVQAKSIVNLGQSSKSLDDFVQEYDPDLLKILTFEDLIIPDQHTALKYALMEDEQFNALTLQNLNEDKDLNGNQKIFIKKRAEKIHNDKENLTQPTHVFDFENFNLTLLRDLFQVSPQDIATHFQKISPSVFGFLSNRQLEGVKLANLSKDQNKALLSSLKAAEKQERLNLFDPSDVLAAVENCVLEGKFLKFLDYNYKKSLVLSQCSKKVLEELFSSEYREEKRQIDKDLFVNYDPHDVKLAIEQGKLTTRYQLNLLSKEQRQVVRLSELPTETDILGKWFNDSYDDEIKEADKVQFADFDKDDVKLAIEQGRLTTRYQLNLLSKEQRQTVRLSKLSSDILGKWFNDSYDDEIKEADKIQFADFDKLDVKLAIEQWNLTTRYQFNLLSKEQRQVVRLSELSTDILDKWFHNSYNDKVKQEDKVQFADFDKDDVAKAIALGKINDYQKSLLSEPQKATIPLTSRAKGEVEQLDKKDLIEQAPEETQMAFEEGILNLKQIPTEHLKAWNFSKMSRENVKKLLPPSSVDDLRKMYSHHSSSLRMKNGKVLENKPFGKHCTYTEPELLKMSKEQQAANEALLNLLNEKQRSDIAIQLALK